MKICELNYKNFANYILNKCVWKHLFKLDLNKARIFDFDEQKEWLFIELKRVFCYYKSRVLRTSR